MVLGAILGGVIANGLGVTPDERRQFACASAGILAAALHAWNLVMLVRYGQTFGKAWAGVRVTDLTGQVPDWRRVVVVRTLLFNVAAGVVLWQGQRTSNGF